MKVLCRKKGGLKSGKPGIGKTTQEPAELIGMAKSKTRIPGPENQNGMRGRAMRWECDVSLLLSMLFLLITAVFISFKHKNIT